MRRALLISTVVAMLLGAPAVVEAADGGATAPQPASATGGAGYTDGAPEGESPPETSGDGQGGADVRTVAAQRRAAARRRAVAKRRAAARRKATARRRAAGQRRLARARKQRRLARKRRQQRRQEQPAPAPAPPPSTDHVFPVQGPFSFGGEGSRFGAGRPGHIHQGQDLSAPLGTPIVAPWGGTIERIAFQRDGAGLYIVLDGDGEDRDYVFMHLRRGSLRVSRGEAVAKGQQLAEVGNTGGSSGAHLHFEIWVGGGWYTGGHPIDPLPYLRAWLP
ncbi:MAG: M23 family metallopeptidase [Thermoleophilaceae bacterium]